MLEKAKCGKNEESLLGKVEKIFLHAVCLDPHSSAGGVGWCVLVSFCLLGNGGLTVVCSFPMWDSGTSGPAGVLLGVPPASIGSLVFLTLYFSPSMM